MVLPVDMAIYLPSRLNVAELTPPESTLNILISLPLSVSQSLTVPPPVVDTINFPSGLNVDEVRYSFYGFEYILNVLIFRPLSTSHSIMVSSPDVNTIYLPSGLNDTGGV